MGGWGVGGSDCIMRPGVFFDAPLPAPGGCETLVVPQAGAMLIKGRSAREAGARRPAELCFPDPGSGRPFSRTLPSGPVARGG